jgi:hypothetical protein
VSLLLLAATAFAGSTELAGGFAWAPDSWDPDAFGASLTAAWWPDRIGASLTLEQRVPLFAPLGEAPSHATQLIPVDPLPETVDISPIIRHASLLLDIVALTGDAYVAGAAHPLRVHLAAGAGLVETHDKLEFLQRTTDPAAIATANQVHPTLELGAGFDLGLTRGIGWGIAGTATRYTETVQTVTRFARWEETWCTGPHIRL